MHAAIEAASLLDSIGEKNKAAKICRNALLIEPYNEPVYVTLMRNLLELGDNDGVIAAYDKMCIQLYENFGALPCEEATEVYRKASSTFDAHPMPEDLVNERLREIETEKGSFICDYDIFKSVYRIEARRVARTKEDYSLVVFSLSGKNLEKAMHDFLEQIRVNLRAGDVASMCSASQYLVLLPTAGKDDAMTVCSRIITAFYRKYPHSSVKIKYSIKPLEPNIL